MKKKPMVKKTFKNVLITSYIVLLSFMLAIGIVSIYYIRQTYENGSEIYTQTLKSIEILKIVDQNIKETDQYIFSMTTELDKENHKDYVNHINRLMDNTAYMVKEYQNIPVSEKEKDRFTRCYYDILSYNRLINQIIEKIESGDVTAALEIYEMELKPVRLSAYESMEAVIDLSEESAAEKNNMNLDAYHQMSVIVIVAMILVILVTILIVVMVTRYINGRLTKIKKWAGNIAEYDVSDDIEMDEKDEFSETYSALNVSQYMVRALIEKIVSESGTICETGEDVTLAINKSNERLENISVKLYDLKDLNSENKTIVERVQKEINDITMYLEQVAITSDYQVEVAKRHKEEVTKFKTKGEDEKVRETVSGETGVLKRM